MTSAWRQRIRGRFSYPSLCLLSSFTYIDITETLKTKSHALECFHSQKNNRCGNFWIDAVVGRCSYRGYQMNVKYAEAFEVVKVTKW